MSDSCRRSDRGSDPASGFTLLELLIVLALIGVMAAMVGPRLQRTYDAIAGSGDRAEVVRQIERMPLIVRERGSAIDIPAGDQAGIMGLMVLPDGWTVDPLQPVRIEASGVCHGSLLRVEGRGVVEDWPLSQPGCEVGDAP